MVNIVTPEYNAFEFEENEDYEWDENAMLNSVNIMEMDMDMDWNTVFDDIQYLEPTEIDVDNNNNATTWDEDYIPEPPVLTRQNAIVPIVLNNNEYVPIHNVVNVAHYLAPQNMIQ